MARLGGRWYPSVGGGTDGRVPVRLGTQPRDLVQIALFALKFALTINSGAFGPTLAASPPRPTDRLTDSCPQFCPQNGFRRGPERNGRMSNSALNRRFRAGWASGGLNGGQEAGRPSGS